MTTDQNEAPRADRGLTPADLQNVRFTRASMLRPGYVDTEVDRVLARVAEELGRLYAEKAALRDHVRSLQAQVDGVVIPEAPSDQAVRILSSAQQTADNYVGRNGVSWLHRWRVALNLPPRLDGEPDPPRWVLQP